MAFADTQKLTVELDLKGNLTQGLSKAARALQGFDRATSNTQRSLGKFGRNIERGIVLGTTAAVGGFVAVAKAAGDFEAQLNTIATIVDRGEIKGIGESLRKIARDTGLGLEDLTQGYYDLASAGIKGKLATDALNDAVTLGIGGLATTTETVNLLTTAINAYGLDSIGAAKATDQFAQAIADGTVKASEIAASFADVASVAKAYHVGIDQIAASYAILTKQGVPASEVATEMQRAIISLINPTKELETAQKKLGINFTKEIGKKGLVGALQELRLYSDKTGVPLIALLGRIEAVKYTLQTTGPEFDGYNAELAKMGKVSGVAAQQMSERQQGLNFQLARLKALAKDAGITIGSALLPKLTPLVEKLNAFITSNQGKIADFGTKLADGFEKFAAAVGKVDWQPFIDGLRISSDIAKEAVRLFMSLPDQVKAVAIGAFAVNKVTGGLGAAVIKDVGGALISQFAARGSSPANPMWVASVGGLPGTGGGGVAGAAGTLVKTVVVPVAAAVAAKEVLNATLPDMQLAQSNFDRAVAAAEARGDTGLLGNKGGTPSNPITVTVGGFTADAVRSVTQSGGFATNFTSPITAGGFDSRVGITAAAQGIKDEFNRFNRIFQDAVAGLKSATKPRDVQKAVAAALAMVVGQRRGNALATSRVLADLKGQLVHTTDPETRKILRDAIAKVEHKLVGRQLVQKQLDKADQIYKSNKSSERKIADLKVIEKSLEHTSKSGAAKVQAKIDAVRKAEEATKRAVDKKDLSVTIPITANVTTGGFDIRNVINGATTIRRYGAVTASVSTRFTNIRPPS